MTTDYRKWLAFGTGVGIEIGNDELQVSIVRVRPSGIAVLGSATVTDFRTRPAAEWGAELQAFLKSKELPDPISPAFVKALQEVLSGLQPVTFGSTELQAALSDGGLPCTVADLRERFDRYVANLTKGKDASKVRILIE